MFREFLPGPKGILLIFKKANNLSVGICIDSELTMNPTHPETMMSQSTYESPLQKSLPVGPQLKKFFNLSREQITFEDLDPLRPHREFDKLPAPLAAFLQDKEAPDEDPWDKAFQQAMIGVCLSGAEDSNSVTDIHFKDSDKPLDSPEAKQVFESLLDELVTMALFKTALTLAHLKTYLFESESFATQLSLGVAAMVNKNFDIAEKAFRKAQALIPEEPAPYVNLIQIFLETQRFKDADIWLKAGLEAQPNHHQLWELVYLRLNPVHGEFTSERIFEEARQQGSWAGISLATSLMSTGDRYLKARELERFYALGERDPLFLIELTGAYGISQEFEKIPPIVWQARKMNSKALPWQLHAHAAQAEIFLGSKVNAKSHIELARKDRFISDEGLMALKELEEELADAGEAMSDATEQHLTPSPTPLM